MSSFKTSNILVDRVQTILHPKTALEDPSAVQRLEQMKVAFEVMPKDISTLLLGSGWGTMRYHIEKTAIGLRGFNVVPESSSNIFGVVFFFSGIFGLIIFLLIVYRVLAICIKVFRNNKANNKYYLFAQGIFLSFIGMLVMGQIASGWISPQFWLVIGCAIFLETFVAPKNITYKT
jgi:hypothetical protein